MSALERRTSLSLLAAPPVPLDRSTVVGLRERYPRASLSQRSWQISWDRHGISIGHSRYRNGEAPPIVRRYFAPSAALLLLCAVVGIGAIGAAPRGESGEAGKYMLSIDIPDRPAARPSLPPPLALVDTVTDTDMAIAAHPIASRARPRPAKSRPAITAPVDDLEPEADVTAVPPSLPDGMFTAEEPAVAAALASGQFQSWQDAAHARRGFVVVSTPERGADRSCRDLTILVRRDGGENDITRRHMCRDGAKGAWR
jgi:hypothetical protein